MHNNSIENKVSNLIISGKSMESDISKISSILDKMDVAIEKLTDVSSNTAQLIGIHGNRLSMQEKLQEKLQDTVDKKKYEIDSTITRIHEKIEKLQENIEKEIKEIKDLLTTQHDIQNEKINKIEKWMWTIIGGSVVLTFLIDKINFSSIF